MVKWNSFSFNRNLISIFIDLIIRFINGKIKLSEIIIKVFAKIISILVRICCTLSKENLLVWTIRNQLRKDTIVDVNIESCHTSMAWSLPRYLYRQK